MKLPKVGHNPFGALAIYIMWGLLFTIILTGWGQDTDWGIEWDIDSWHQYSVDAMKAMVCLHLGAVLFTSVWLRQNLVRAMLRGHYNRRQSD